MKRRGGNVMSEREMKGITEEIRRAVKDWGDSFSEVSESPPVIILLERHFKKEDIGKESCSKCSHVQVGDCEGEGLVGNECVICAQRQHLWYR